MKMRKMKETWSLVEHIWLGDRCVYEKGRALLVSLLV